MMSRPGQPRLAMHYQLLLFHPVINTPRCLQGHIRALMAWTLGLPVFPVQKGHDFAITVTLSPRPRLNTTRGTLLLE